MEEEKRRKKQTVGVHKTKGHGKRQVIEQTKLDAWLVMKPLLRLFYKCVAAPKIVPLPYKKTSEL